MMTKTLTPLAAFLVAFCFMLPAANAQDVPPELAEIWLLEPKPGHSKEFFAGITAHMAFRHEQGDPRAWQAYTPVLGDALNRLAVRFCCISWADVDAYDAWQEGQPDMQAHFEEHVTPHIASAAHYFESIDWANSHWSDARAPYELFAVTEYLVEPENAEQFDAARVKMSQIALQQGWASDDNVWLWMSTIGGAPVQSIVIPHRNYADIENGEQSFMAFLADKLGSAEEAAELVQEFLGASEGSNYQLWKHHPDLSMPESD